MKLLESSEQERLQAVDRVRLVNAAARLLGVYQTAALTLQKLKTKGQQRVVVQYQQVNVGEGDQAVVATTVRGGLRRKGRGMAKIADEPRGKRRGWLLNGNPPGRFLDSSAMPGEDPPRDSVSSPGNGMSLSSAWRARAQPENSRRTRGLPPSAVEARVLLEGGGRPARQGSSTLKMLRALAAGVVEITFYTDDDGRRRSRWGR